MVEDNKTETKKPETTGWVCEWDNVHDDIVLFTTPKPKEKETIKTKEDEKV